MQEEERGKGGKVRGGCASHLLIVRVQYAKGVLVLGRSTEDGVWEGANGGVASRTCCYYGIGRQKEAKYAAGKIGRGGRCEAGAGHGAGVNQPGEKPASQVIGISRQPRFFAAAGAKRLRSSAAWRGPGHLPWSRMTETGEALRRSEQARHETHGELTLGGGNWVMETRSLACDSLRSRFCRWTPCTSITYELV